MAELPLFDLRLYQAGQPGYLSVPLDQVAHGSWRVQADGLYVSARFTVATPRSVGSVASLLKPGRRIEAWGRSKDGASQVRLWSGEILQASPSQDAPFPIEVTCAGRWAAVSRLPVPTPLIFPSRVDLSQAFTAAVAAALGSSSDSFQVGAPTFGLTTDSLEDAYEQPLSEAVGALSGLGAGSVVYGSDVVGDLPGEDFGSTGMWGRERLGFYPFDPATTIRYAFSIPDPQHAVTRRETEEDASRLANVLKIVGGSLANGNLLEGPTQDNARLDRIYRSGSGGTNFLLTPGFESGGDWTYSGGASRKADTDVYGPSDGNGKWFTLLDNLGEKILQRPLVPGGVQAGRTYVFNARVRQATNKADGSASTDAVTLRLRFFTAGGVQVGADVTAPSAPAGAGVWRDAQVSAAAPATATQVEAEIELTARTPGATASTLGVAIDNCSLYDGSLIAQRGWFLTEKPGSSAVIARQNWQAPGQGGAFGPYALEVSGTSSDDYDNDFWLVPGTAPNEELAAVSGGQGLTLSYWLKRLPDGSANPKLILEIDWRDKEGRYISPSRATIAAGALTTSFVQYTLTASAPANATGAIVRLRSRGNGGFVLDAAQLRDSSEATGEFVQGDSWQSDHRASAMPGLTAPQQASNALYGDVYERVEEPLIRTQADADAYALAVFKARCLPIQRPSVEVSGHAEAWRPGQWLRAIGREGASFLPSPLPIAELEGRWEGGQLSTTLTLGAPPDTRQRLLQRLLEGVSKGAAGASSRSYGAPSSGSALAYAMGAVAYPIALDKGGTAAMDAAGARTNLGLVRGDNLLPLSATNGQLPAFRTASGLWVASGVAVLLDSGLTLTPGSITDNPLTLQGIAGQTGDFLRVRSSAGAVLAQIASTGAFAFGNVMNPIFSSVASVHSWGLTTQGVNQIIVSTNGVGGLSVANAAHRGFSLQLSPQYNLASIRVRSTAGVETDLVRFSIAGNDRLWPQVGYRSVDGSNGVSLTGLGLTWKDGILTAGAVAVSDTDLGTRTVDDTLVPTGNTSSLTTLLSCLSNRVRAVTGGATWFSAIPETLTSLKSRVDAILTTLAGYGNVVTRNAPASGNATAAQVVLGSDTRLTDARTPTTHNQDASTITSGTLATARLPLHNLLNGGGTDIGVGIVRILEGNPSAGVISVGAWPTGDERMRLLIVHNPSGTSATISFPSTTGTITGSTTLAAGATSIWSLSSFSAGVWNARRLT